MAEWWQQFWEGLRSGWANVQDGAAAGRVLGGMLTAAALGGLLGLEREHRGKAAGLRTHMLVALGTAFFVLVSRQAGLPDNSVSRVIQGIAAGIGFIGAGTILKQNEEGRIRGLTTAAGIWLTAAVGVAVGLGRDMSALLVTGLALLILEVVGKIEARYGR
jgi:putative Mg2+ transporter-C (MgtC) family protein